MAGVNTRDKIIVIAEKYFSERGYVGTRLSDIALECGIKRPSILYYFASKIELAQAVIEKQHNECKEEVFDSLQDTDYSPREKAVYAIRNLRLYLERHPENPMVSFLFATHIDGLEQAVVQYYDAWLTSLYELLVTFHKPNEAKQLAKLSLILIKGYLSTSRLFNRCEDLDLLMKFIRRLWTMEKESAPLAI